jgi:glycosyl transferase, family 25
VRLAIRIISLAGSDQRRAHMAAQMARVGVPWSFFDARRELPEGLTYTPARARWNRGRELTPGEIGCFGSHVSLWRELVADPDLDGLVVMEDDLVIDWSFFGAIERFAQNCPLPYVRFYGKLPVQMTEVQETVGRRRIVTFQRPVYGTQAYWITRAGAQRFLSSIQDVVRPIDDEMDRVWAHGVPSAGVFPFPVVEVDFGSTIEAARRGLPPLAPRDQLRRQYFRSVEKLRRVAHYGLVSVRGHRDLRSLKG